MYVGMLCMYVGYFGNLCYVCMWVRVVNMYVWMCGWSVCMDFVWTVMHVGMLVMFVCMYCA